ncbi:phosphotransferase [Aestuariibacter salexigens]|uniref:phosphotransferase n=1 Tax=Aestuariibacter salexigens TaxID=226010 RepID=UPI00047AF2A2|nr:phosphotransferase [Aestuariibacter salexigens]
MNNKSMITSNLSHHLGGDWHKKETIQTLWSGYGEIARYVDKQNASVVVKHVDVPQHIEHPRGWGGEHSHRRKCISYQVEAHFYQQYASACESTCRVPLLYFSIAHQPAPVLVMQDLDALGFSARPKTLTSVQIKAVLRWLANFHARHLGIKDDALWPVGTYWHLATRKDEFEVMPPGRLRAAASLIDSTLNQATYQTLVHGDAKLANFCFSHDGDDVAAVDFQYVGAGVGIKDVAYFLGSCLDDDALQACANDYLDYYFFALRSALDQCDKAHLAANVEAEWCCLYPLAWADFFRFLSGWNPHHQKINLYMQAMTSKALSSLAFQP